MRQDAKLLLERLGQRGFVYEDFTDPASEIEPWPIFAALLRDPKVVGITADRSLGAAPVRAAPPAEIKSGLFGGYDRVGRLSTATTAKASGPNLGDFLDRLADQA